MTNPPLQHPEFEAARIMGELYGAGFIGHKKAFDRDWAGRLREDIDLIFENAKKMPGGVLNRGPNRFYVEVHPERIRGFLDMITHPWLIAVCLAVLGPDYRIVETGFDISEPGAQDQPWHRDFAMPQATALGRRLDSLAFNITAVDVTDDMGPLEIAPGTQWDDLTTAADPSEMFPVKSSTARYVALAQRKMPELGDMSARSALTIHRGTANHSSKSRPIFVVGVDAPGASNAARHDLQVSAAYHASLPASVRCHLAARVVDCLESIVQAHTIDALTVGP